MVSGDNPPLFTQNAFPARGENAGVPPRREPVHRQWGLFPRRTVVRGRGAGEARPPPTHNSSLARGENAGVPPGCGPVRRQGITEFCPSNRWTLDTMCWPGGVGRGKVWPVPTPQRPTVFGGGRPGNARPAPTKNSFYARGENAGSPPRHGPVRRQGTTQNDGRDASCSTGNVLGHPSRRFSPCNGT